MYKNIKKNISGIYQIRNKINNKSYIGCAFDIRRRLKEHTNLLRNNKHYNIYLQRAWNKYGEENFEVIILFEGSKDNLLEYEIKFIEMYNTVVPNGYNLTSGGQGLANYSHTLEARKKISNALKGIKRSEETRKRISLAQIGHKKNLGKRHTIETKIKISNTKRAKVNEEYRETYRRLSQGKKKQKRSSSKYVGVRFRAGKWEAQITYCGKYIYLGRYTNEIDAAIAYNKAALNFYGTSAKINNIEMGGI